MADDRRHHRPRASFPPLGPPLPPPEHGIRVTKIGATWWGERWVEALARFGRDYAARLHRGRTYARQGRVHDLTAKDGVVTASVTGSRPEPYRVTLALRPLSDATWEHAIRAMAGKARFAAQLLGGEMPHGIGAAFNAARASLFPARADDLRTECTCPDWANPCKHVAAVHYVLAEAFDRDPFLLFELRGRTKEAVLRSLREARAGTSTTTPEAPAQAAKQAVATWPPAAYDVFREPVDDLRFRIAAPAAGHASFRHLGAPPAWSLDVSLADVLQPAVSRAARLATEIALGAPPES